MYSWRGAQAGRIEALTDTVFGFSITLLVVSLEVPANFDDLVGVMRGFVPFAASFALLAVVWYYHYRFFRQFPLGDGRTVLLNSVLLFVIVFYVYPLKFVSNFLVGTAETRVEVRPADVSTMMAIYALGFVLVFGLFALLYRHAYKLRHSLELTEAEALSTRESLADCLVMAAVGILSGSLALTAPVPWGGAVAGFSYFLIWPAQVVVHRKFVRMRASLIAAPAPAAAAGGTANDPALPLPY